MGSEVKFRLVSLFIDDTPIETGIASRGEVLDSAVHSSLLAVDPVKYVNKMSNGQMLL